MRRNDERRELLVDAAIEVLAREGARGLTFRAVDSTAAVPAGTASNYFTNRDDLLTQAGSRVYERLQPDEATLTRQRGLPGTRETHIVLIRDLLEKISTFRTGHLALLELRLEAVRRPHLREVLTTRVRADLDANISQHHASGLPGDSTGVLILYLAINWLIVERLTLPDAMTAEEQDRLISAAVDRLMVL
jgi:DNA-binding transcriptional regulator YbjK